MNIKRIISSTILCALILVSFSSFAQKKDLRYKVGASAAISSKSTLPFWLVSNKNGIIPDENNGLLFLNIKSDFTPSKSNFDFSYAASLVGSQGKKGEVFFDELYTSLKWKTIFLDLGIKHEKTLFNNISSTNGNIFNSRNSRPIPKLSIGFRNYIPLPYLEDWLAIKGLYSEGIMLDDRSVDKTHIHYKNAYIKIGGNRKLNFILGFQHYAMWGGTSSNPKYGKLPSNFENYIRVIQAKGGTDESLYFEWENSVGNHLGGWDIHLSYKTTKFSMELYRQTMLEDHSGIYITRPDGVTGFFAEYNKGKRWIQSFIYENYYTKYQSGSTPGGSPNPNGGLYTGQDNYFNNGIYQSGWTYYGKTIGLPFFYPSSDKDGLSTGIYNNRIIGHHLGATGYLFHKIPYRAMLSYTQNWGTYGSPFTSGMKEQVSGLFEMNLPKDKLPFDISFTIAFDKGQVLKDNIGCFLKLSRSGLL